MNSSKYRFGCRWQRRELIKSFPSAGRFLKIHNDIQDISSRYFKELLIGVQSIPLPRSYNTLLK